ncbi:MAG: hypothetical protein VW378_07720, partial [bacterium]
MKKILLFLGLLCLMTYTQSKANQISLEVGVKDKNTHEYLKSGTKEILLELFDKNKESVNFSVIRRVEVDNTGFFSLTFDPPNKEQLKESSYFKIAEIGNQNYPIGLSDYTPLNIALKAAYALTANTSDSLVPNYEKQFLKAGIETTGNLTLTDNSRLDFGETTTLNVKGAFVFKGTPITLEMLNTSYSPASNQNATNHNSNYITANTLEIKSLDNIHSFIWLSESGISSNKNLTINGSISANTLLISNGLTLTGNLNMGTNQLTPDTLASLL